MSLPPWIGLSVGTKFRDVPVLLTLRDPVPGHTSVMKTTYKTLDVPSISPQNIGVKLLNKNTVKTIIPAKQLTLYCSQPIENYKIPMLANCTCCCAE